jgi:DNA-binding CsgD family transcriptional regulator
MQFLTEKEWIFLNEISHMIHDTENLDEMRINLMDLLAVLIPNSCASFYMANNNDGKLLYNPVANNIERKDVTNYLEYGEGLDYTIPIFKSARPIAYKETDLFDNAAREKTEFYNEFLAHGLEYPMALCIAHNGKCYGALSLFRSKRMGDFCDRDVFILNQLHNHLATRICLHKHSKTDLVFHKIDEIKQSKLLTSRESEIVDLILEGFSNEEISSRLFVELGTVKKHIHNIYSKFNVKNRMQLLRVFLG